MFDDRRGPVGTDFEKVRGQRSMSGSRGPETIRRNRHTATARSIAVMLCALLFLSNIVPTIGTPGNVSADTYDLSDKGTILTVPYYDQGDTSWCLYYCLAMMYNYNGCSVEPWEIAEHFGSGHSETFSGQYNTYDMSLEKHAESPYSLSVRKTVWGNDILDQYDRENFNASIIRNIDRGQPVLMAFQYENSEGSKEGHAIIAIGYDYEYIYLTDPSGAITEGVFGINDKRMAVPVTWDEFNEKLVNKIMPLNLAFTVEVLNDAPDRSQEGSIYVTDRSNSNSSSLIFTNRYDVNDIGLLRLDGTYENGYAIIRKGNVTSERELTTRDSMSVYFTVSNPTSEQKEYTIQSDLIDMSTGQVVDNFFFGTEVTVSPFSQEAKGINYSNQLEAIGTQDCRLVLTLRDENLNVVDSIRFDIHVE